MLFSFDVIFFIWNFEVLFKFDFLGVKMIRLIFCCLYALRSPFGWTEEQGDLLLRDILVLNPTNINKGH